MPSEKPDPSSQTTARELERLTLICVSCINNRDWTYSSPDAQLFFSHVDIPNFWAQFDSYPRAMNWHEQNEAWQAMFSEHPDAKFNVTHIDTTVDEQMGTATVMMESEVPNVGAVTLRGLSVATWKRVEGKWLFHRTVGMRGTGGNAGFVT